MCADRDDLAWPCVGTEYANETELRAGSWPRTRSPWALFLNEVGENHRPFVGGKAANLAKMFHAKLPVPPGFCVTVPAFKAFLDSCPRREQFQQIQSQAITAGPDQAMELSRRLTACLAGTPIPPHVQDAVLSCWRLQGAERVYAVRSSATVEDAAEHSFAGQFESFLNVRGQGALLDAIMKCWFALFSARVLAYQAESRISADKVGMAVVVQEMVPAETAGVLFTADPVSGTKHMIIEATPGLGDRLVSGRVDPVRIVLDKASLRVLRQNSSGNAPGFDKALGRRVGKVGRKVEHLFGQPQDIEWAMVGRHVFLLQTRPITANARAAQSWEERQVWCNLNLGEVAPDVMTPATWSVLFSFLEQIAASVIRMLGADITRSPFIGLVAGRAYFNVNAGLAAMKPLPRALLRNANLAKALGGAEITADCPWFWEIAEQDLPDLGFTWTKYLLSWPRILWDLIAHSPRRGDAWTAELKADNDARSREEFSSLPRAELVRRLDQVLSAGFRGWDLMYLVTQAFALPVFQKACRDWLDDWDLTLGHRLFAGLGGIPETEAGLALWRLAELANRDRETEAALLSQDDWATVRARLSLTANGREWVSAWNAFMAEHGHHCRGELELFNPRWAETPDYILGIVRGYLRAIDQTNPLENQRRLAQEREQLTGQCRQRLKNPIQRWIFSRSLRRAQKLAVNREEWKNQAVRQLTILRRIVLALGAQLERDGILPSADSIFFLEVTEIRLVATGRARFDVSAALQARRAEYEHNLKLSPPPIVVGRFDPTKAAPADVSPKLAVLSGIPVFPGEVTGRARVILRTEEHEQVLPGEILIAPFTDPAWTPYFVTAAGVVMDQGGILSHGSIVAREYGLPAVTNVGCATRVIRTGDLVRVNGRSGQVTVLKRAVDQ